MAKRISSKNQSGGITADRVEIHGDVSMPAKAEVSGSKTWKRVFAILAALAAIVAVLTYLGIQPKEAKVPDETEGSVVVTSHNQSGGITANKVTINNIVQSVTPELRARVIDLLEPVNGGFVTRVELLSDQPIPNLFLAARASSILSFAVRPQRAGMVITGHSGKREGLHFTNIPNFHGTYLAVIRTSRSETIIMEHDY